MLDSKSLFETILKNLKVSNADRIKTRRNDITKSLNEHFRETNSDTKNRIMVGSWGRKTAIDGVSDLDLIYILPSSLYSDFHKAGGTYKALSKTREAILAHYPKTDIRVDRLVVVVQFSNYKFEVQPCFELDDGSFEYPDTYSDKWKTTKPRDEIQAITDLSNETAGRARDLCRLIRAWNRKHEGGMGGLLIDTLVWRFLNYEATESDKKSSIDCLLRDFFTYLKELPKQDYWAALGSGQRVKVKKNFQGKAKRAFTLCEEAMNAEDSETAIKRWRKILGRFVPLDIETNSIRSEEVYKDTEEFIEDHYTLNLQYEIGLDCIVTQNGFRPASLLDMLKNHIFLRPLKRLEFQVDAKGLPESFEIKWKVLNQGDEAEQRNQIRGQIITGNRENKFQHVEHTQFQGNHYVECYAIRADEVIAMAHIEVPIRTTQTGNDSTN